MGPTRRSPLALWLPLTSAAAAVPTCCAVLVLCCLRSSCRADRVEGPEAWMPPKGEDMETIVK